MSKNFMLGVKSVKLKQCTVAPDHSGVLTKFLVGNNKHGPGYWNNSVISEQSYKQGIINIIGETAKLFTQL